MASASWTSVSLQVSVSYVVIFMLKKKMQTRASHKPDITKGHSISEYKDNQILDGETQQDCGHRNPKHSIEFYKIEISICFKPLYL
jgi:hypothetical protein